MTSINPSSGALLSTASQLPTWRLLFNALMEKNFTEADKYVDPFFLTEWSGDGRTLLHWMVVEQNPEACEYLLLKGMDVNIRSRPSLNDSEVKGWSEFDKRTYAEEVKRNGNGFTPLHYAIFKNNEELAALLCSKGANPNLVEIRGFSPFSIAICNQLSTAIIDLLINAGAELDPLITQGGVSAYFSERLLKNRAYPQLRRLLELNIDITKPGIRGFTLLQLAIRLNAQEIIPDLLKKEAAVHYLEPESKKSALYFARAMEYPDCSWLKELIKQDNGFSEQLLELQVLASRFGIHHPLVAGNSAYSAFPSLIESLSKFKEELGGEELKICQATIDEMKNIYENQNNPSYFIQRIERNLPTIVPLVFPKHAYTIGVSDLLIKCNRGLGIFGNPGISCYKITNPTFKTSVISHLFALQPSPLIDFNQDAYESNIQLSQEEALRFINLDLHSVLELSRIGGLTQKRQKVGTCGLVAAKQSIFLSAYFVYRSMGYENFQALLKAKREFYFKWRSFDRLFVLQKIASPTFSRFHKDFDFHNLFGKIFLNAVRGRKYNVIEYLLKEKPEIIHYKDPTTGGNCLFAAARHLHKRKATLFPMLVKHGANVTLRTQNQSSLLHEAAKYGNESLAQTLLQEYHLDATAANSEGNTPLHEAARFGSANICYYLHKKGADLNAQNHCGETPLLLATHTPEHRLNKKFAIRYLLRSGANPNIPSKDGFTALGFLAAQNLPNLCKEFIRAGANINLSDPKTAPLYLAVKYRASEVVEILIANHADHTLCIDGFNLYEIAQQNDDYSIQCQLLELPFFKQLFEKRQIVSSISFRARGSQYCDFYALDSKIVLDFVIQLNQKSPFPNIIFNSANKPLYIIGGGTCSAMSLSWVSLLIQNPQAPVLELFQKDQRFLNSSPLFRNTQAAMNCIEVVGSCDFEEAEARKMAALAAFYDLQIEKTYVTINLSEMNTPDFSEKIFNLEEGLYISRIVDRATNVKMENRGHTTILEKRDGEFHYYDPNHGLSVAEITETNADVIAAFIKQTSMKWQTFYHTFYRVFRKS